MQVQSVKSWLVATSLIAACGLGACSRSIPAPPTAATASTQTLGAKDLAGVWVPTGSFDDPIGPAPWQNTPWPAEPPFTAWGAAESKRLDDHNNFRACTPSGPVYFMWEIGLFPIQFLQAPDQLVILREATGMPRRIYTDGRGHPEDLEPSWMGHSIGRWEGDVLVVDTIGLNGKARAMNGVGANALVSTEDAKPRMPSSEALHLVERFKLVANGELLEDELTITDTKVFTEPVVLKHYFQRRPDIDMLEYFCNDNPRDDSVTSKSE
jgi:hypothetical protein